MQHITSETTDRPNAKKLVVLGANGKLGSRIINILNNHDNLVLSGCITRDNSTYEYLDDCDVVIDVSSAEGTKNLINYIMKKNITKPLVIGTTGNLPINIIEDYAKTAPVALISNFSRGIPQLVELIHHIDSDMWDIDIEETHHIHKKDAPSGTAKTLAREFKGNCKIDLNNIKSYREGEVIGEHTIILKNNLETLSITHSAKSRDIFADGALRYASWILNKKSGLYIGMKDNKIQFSKYVGYENDFIILKDSEVAEVSKEFVEKLCHRKKSIGADGLLLVDSQCQDKIIKWTHYDSYGYIVNKCVESTRCVAQYCIDNGIVKIDDNFTLLHKTSGICTKVTSENGLLFIDIPEITTRHDSKSFYFVDGLEELEKQNMILSLGPIVFAVSGVDYAVCRLNQTVDNDMLIKYARFFQKNVKINFYWERDGKLYVKTFQGDCKGDYTEYTECNIGCYLVAYSMFALSQFHNILNIFDQTEPKYTRNGDRACHIRYKIPDVKHTYETITGSGQTIFVTITPNISISASGYAVKVYDGYI